MTDFAQRWAPPSLVVIVSFLLVMIVHLLVSPQVERNTRRLITQTIPETGNDIWIGSSETTSSGSVENFWPVYDGENVLMGIVGLTRGFGYQSRIDALIGVSLSGETWGVIVLSSFEHGTFPNGYSVDYLDGITGSTVSVRALEQSIATVHEVAAAFAAELREASR